MVHPSSTVVRPKLKPPPMTDTPPEFEPRQVSMPAAARPGAITVGGVISRLVEVVLAGLVMLMAADAPDELPELWANAGLAARSTTNATTIRMTAASDRHR